MNKRLRMGLVLLFVLILTACSNKKDNNSEIVVAVISEPDTLDIHKTSSIGDETAAIYESFLKMDDSGDIIPGVIQDYKVSNEGKTIEFKIGENQFFHSGESITSENIKQSFERFMDNSPFYDNIGDVQSIEVIDDLNFKINFNEPYAPFFSNSVSPYLAPLDVSALNETKDKFKEMPSGSGPLQVTKVNRGDSITYKPFEQYLWKNNKPNFDSVKYRFIPDEETRLLEFKKGNINVLTNVPVQYLEELEEMEDVKVERVSDYVLHYLGWNNKHPKFQDKNVRKAIALAINRDPIIQNALNGNAKKNFGPLPEATFGYSKEIEEKAKEEYEYNIELSKDLMKSAGWDLEEGIAKKGDEVFEVELWVDQDPAKQRIAQIIQNQLNEIGIKVNISVRESATIIEQTPKGMHEMILWSYGWLDADVMYFLLFGEGKSTRLHYENEVLNKILLDARIEMDIDSRLKLYEKAQEFIIEETPFVPLYVKDTIHATKGLETFKVHPIRNYIMWDEVKIKEDN